jgi:pyrroline-5-carboxylate reductase
MIPSERSALPATPPLIACVGGGNMARALVEGSIRAGAISAREWLIAEPDEGKRRGFEEIGVAAVGSVAGLVGRLGEATQVLLAVKPQALEAVAAEGAGVSGVAGSGFSLGAGRVVISILAGTPSSKVAALLPGCRVVRAMPNTPAQIGLGCTAIALGMGAQAGDEALALRLFAGVGPVVERIEESLMDAFTAVAGSGPAYVFYLAEAMTRAAVELGFEPAVADRIVRQVLTGSAGLLAGSAGRSAAELRAAVTSKGGTTEAACRVLDDAGVMRVIVAALGAARDRGRELAG